MPAEIAQWRRCSSCKTPIAFGAAYWVCNVSTCNRPRTGLFFCTVSCWDAHLSVVNHRESWALERRAPSREQWQREQQSAVPSPPKHGTVTSGATGSSGLSPQAAEGGARRGEAERSSSGLETAQQPNRPQADSRSEPKHGAVASEASRAPGASASAREAGARSERSERSQQLGERSSSGLAAARLPRDVLIVVSKLKAYVRARSGFNTSDRVAEPLSDAVRELCDRAVEKARADGRKTVLERDFE